MLQDAASREIFGTSFFFFLGNLVHGDADDLLLCVLPDRFLRHQRCLHALFCFFSGCACEQLLRAILCLVGRVSVVLPFLKLPKLQKNLAERSPVVMERRTAIRTENSPDGSNSKTPSFSQRAPCGSKTGPSCGSHRASLGSNREPSRFLHKVVTVLTESPCVSYREPPSVRTESLPAIARVRVLTVICRFGAHGQHCRSLVDGRWCAMYLNTDTGARPSCTAG